MSASKPKILMLTTQLGYGGAETSFIRLANCLAQSMEVTVALFTSDYGKGAYAAGHEPLNAAITLLDGPPCGRIQRWVRRIRAVRRLKAKHDVTISFLSGPNFVNAIAGHNARTIVSLRGSRIYDPVASKKQKWFFQNILDPITFSCAARIVPVSPGIQNEIRQVVGEVPLKKVRVISPFIDPDAIARRLSETPPVEYASLKGQKVIVATGRLSVEKGFQHLIRVFSEVVPAHRDAKLLLVGDGPMHEELLSLCAALNLPVNDLTPGIASVIFAGYQKNVLPLMTLGQLYAMTSATEGFPNVVLEAMAAGLPVIAADTPWGARAILTRGEGEAPRDPYPTDAATPVEYGMLMPRIDTQEGQKIWAQTLIEIFDGKRTIAPCPGRVNDFTIAIVGARWRQVIAELMA